jgi:hypothetical protein
MDYSGVTPASGPIFQEVLSGVGLPANLKYHGLHPMQRNYVPSYFLFNLNGTYSFREGPRPMGCRCTCRSTTCSTSSHL